MFHDGDIRPFDFHMLSDQQPMIIARRYQQEPHY
jgi:hypothetical protein